MNLFGILTVALGLAMDAFAVSVSNGIATSDYRWHHGLKMGLFFGTFQFSMTVIGFFLGTTFSRSISTIDHYIAFVLLLLIGGKTIYEAVKRGEECRSTGEAENTLTFSVLTIQGVATSIDALAVGISMAILNVNIWLSAGIIGAVAFIFPFFGGLAGRFIGKCLGRFAEIAGGLILIIIGSKILVEHLTA